MKNNPPRLFLKFFRWYCHPRMQDYIEGDLMEVYAVRLAKFGKRKADLKFIIDVLLLFRPSIIRPSGNYKNIINYSMFRNYFKIGYRNLIKNKSYAMINITGLALSITCGIFIFSLVRQNLRTNLPCRHRIAPRCDRLPKQCTLTVGRALPA
jgi:putative ABC transport system permease protein